MSKEKYNQIIDEAYENYFNNFLGYDDVPTKEVFVFEEIIYTLQKER